MFDYSLYKMELKKTESVYQYRRADSEAFPCCTILPQGRCKPFYQWILSFTYAMLIKFASISSSILAFVVFVQSR